MKSTMAFLPSWFLQGLGALPGEGRRAWWPLLDPPRKGAGVWGKGSRLVINESSYLGRPCPRGGQGKRCRRFSRGWEASDGQDPKPRNSRHNTSQSRDTGGLGGTTWTFQGKPVGERAQLRGGEQAQERPKETQVGMQAWGESMILPQSPGHTRQRLQKQASLKWRRDGG